MADNFYIAAKRTVYKWWCVVYRPAYQLFHHGYWPAEKDPYVKYPSADAPAVQHDPQKQLAQAMAAQIVESNRSSQHSVDDIIQSVETQTSSNMSAYSSDVSVHSQAVKEVPPKEESNSSSSDSALDPTEIPAGVDDDVLARANEIMARLNQEAAADAAKKQEEIDKAKAFAAEQERLASIMKANSVDIEEFIEEGRSKQEHTEDNSESTNSNSNGGEVVAQNEFNI